MRLHPIVKDPISNIFFYLTWNNNTEPINDPQAMFNVPISLTLESNKSVSVWRSRYMHIKTTLFETTRNFFRKNIPDQTASPGYLSHRATILSKHMKDDLDETHQIDIHIIADVLYNRDLDLDVIGIYDHPDFPKHRFLFKEKCRIHIWIKAYQTPRNSVIHSNDLPLSINHSDIGIYCSPPTLLVYGNSCSQGHLKGIRFIGLTLSDILNLEISYSVSSNSDRINRLVLAAVCNLSSYIYKPSPSIHQRLHD